LSLSNSLTDLALRINEAHHRALGKAHIPLRRAFPETPRRHWREETKNPLYAPTASKKKYSLAIGQGR